MHSHCCFFLEHSVMVHRYLYFVVGLPVLSNTEYNALVIYAQSKLPISSKVHTPGALYAATDDYTEEQRLSAHYLIR